jgi:hypothetical protein
VPPEPPSTCAAQATHAEAKKLCELAKRLSGEGAAALLSVLSSHALPNDQRWAFQRPLLRLLLWLLPEHIPAAQAQQGTPAPGGRSSNSNSPEPSTAGGLGPTQGGQAAKGKPSKSTTPAGPNEKEWHGSFALTFILGILSVCHLMDPMPGQTAPCSSLPAAAWHQATWLCVTRHRRMSLGQMLLGLPLWVSG